MFLDAKQRGIAIGAWAASISAGVALGPLLSGLLLEVFSWRATFLVAVPVMAIVVIGAPLLLPEHRDASAGRLDLVSVALLLATLLPFIYGVKTLAKDDALGVALGTIAVGVAFGVWFVIRQLRSAAPLLDVRLFANRTVSGALGVFILAAAALGGMYLMFTQYLQLVADLSPLQTGLAILPAALLLVGVSMFSPILARRVRPGHTSSPVGLAVQVVGYLMLTQVESVGRAAAADRGLHRAVPGGQPGHGAHHRPGRRLGAAGEGRRGVRPDHHRERPGHLAGHRAHRQHRRRRSTATRSPHPARRAAGRRGRGGEGQPRRRGVRGERAVAGRGAAVLEPARAAFTSGLNLGALIAAVIAAVGAILAATRLRHVPPTGKAAGEAAEPAHAESRGEAAAVRSPAGWPRRRGRPAAARRTTRDGVDMDDRRVSAGSCSSAGSG